MKIRKRREKHTKRSREKKLTRIGDVHVLILIPILITIILRNAFGSFTPKTKRKPTTPCSCSLRVKQALNIQHLVLVRSVHITSTREVTQTS